MLKESIKDIYISMYIPSEWPGETLLSSLKLYSAKLLPTIRQRLKYN